MADIKKLTDKVHQVIEQYKLDYPDVKMGRDYVPFKLTEEWGECLQTYLMLTDRGRQKGLAKDQIKEMLEDEMADVFGYLLAFADNEDVDLAKALERKWFKFLKNKT